LFKVWIYVIFKPNQETSLAMELKKLIHQLRHENSRMGEVTREIEKDKRYYSLQNVAQLKEYLNKRLIRKGFLNEFVELLRIHEIIHEYEVVD
jgi:hypothetical protein